MTFLTFVPFVPFVPFARDRPDRAHWGPAMLNDHDSSAIVGVTALERAGAFYGGVPARELTDEAGRGGVLISRTGATRLVVYASDYAGTNRANAVVWSVGGELDSI